MDKEILIKTTKTDGFMKMGKETVNLKQVLSLNLYKILEKKKKKILSGRIKNPEKEKIRLDYIKAYINGCNCFKAMTGNVKYDPDIITEYLDTPVEMVDIEPDDDDYME